MLILKKDNNKKTDDNIIRFNPINWIISIFLFFDKLKVNRKTDTRKI